MGPAGSNEVQPRGALRLGGLALADNHRSNLAALQTVQGQHVLCGALRVLGCAPHQPQALPPQGVRACAVLLAGVGRG